MFIKANIRNRIRNFLKKNRKIIIIVLIVWCALLAINMLLKNMPKKIKPITTYEPHVSIMQTGTNVPESLKEPIENMLDKFFNYCNNKEYENAYNMLSEEFKLEYYPSIDGFKIYVDRVFDEPKIYNIQNFSNIDNTYVYRIRILEDLLETGLTGKEDVIFYEEKVVIKYENKQLKLSLQQYIGKQELDSVYEDEFIKVKLENVNRIYDSEVYVLSFTNKTEYTIVLSDYLESGEIFLNVGNQKRNISNNYHQIVLQPWESMQKSLSFTKFYDEENESTELVFNAVRVFDVYSGLEINKEEELENAIKLYSFILKIE